MSYLSDVLGENMELLFAEKQLRQFYKLYAVADQDRSEAASAGSRIGHLSDVDRELLTLIPMFVFKKSTFHSDGTSGVVMKKAEQAHQDG